MATPGTGDLLVILFILALILGAGKTSWLADRIAHAWERKGVAREEHRAPSEAERRSASPR